MHAAHVSCADALRALAAAWGADLTPDTHEFPADRIAALAGTGALAAFATLSPGAETTALLDALRIVGGADLSVGRIFEGHVNAGQIVDAYGTDAQRERLAGDLAAGRLMGVWSTEAPPGVTLHGAGDNARLEGAKTFATGGGHLDRVLITARTEAGAKQLVLVDVAGEAGRSDNSGWRVRGMRATGSGRFDFSGMSGDALSLIGGAGDYEREPRFSGGAWRFTAVQLGAVEALVRHLRDHLVATGKADDPLHRRRFGDAVAAARSAGHWVREAAQRAESGAPGAVPFVLMTRGVVEEAGLLVMEAAARGAGTSSFFDGNRIDRITRDLGLYLRQPVPDQARDRAAAAWLEADCWDGDPWW